MQRQRVAVGVWILAFGVLGLAAGCGGGGGDAPPTASAGVDQTVTEDTLVTLSGTAAAGSSPVASLAWTQTAGPAVSLSGADTESPSFTAPKAPIQDTVIVEFLFTVTDTSGWTDADSVSVVVTSDDFALFIALKDTLEAQELYKSDVENGTVTKLSGPLVVGGSVFVYSMSPDGRYVAYVADQDADDVYELYVARTDGSGFVKASGVLVADGDVALSSPFWASDSSRVAYLADQDTNDVLELFSSRPDGSGNAKVNGTLVAGGAVQVTPGDPWAPDSSRIAYAADQDTPGVVEVFTSMPDGMGNVKVSGALMPGGGVNTSGPLLWAPDSSRIAYLAHQGNPAELELYGAEPTGAGAQRLNGTLGAGGTVGSMYEWTADASRIAYLATPDASSVQSVYSSLADGTVSVRLNPPLLPGRVVVTFSVAPDGSRVAYVADQDLNDVFEFYTSLIAGGGNAKLNGPLMGPNFSFNLRWAPDSSRVAYAAYQDSATEREIFTSFPDGTGNVKINGLLTAESAADVNATPSSGRTAWSPDASLLSFVVFPPLGGAITAEAGLPDGSGSVEYTGAMVVGGSLSQWPQWSSDGSHLLYSARQDSDTMTELYLASPDGTYNEKISGPLVATGTVSPNYTWSP